ncbi:MAG: SMC-Scp complex subunit ScpB [bacterium]|jgi:segregation and condensation protein B
MGNVKTDSENPVRGPEPPDKSGQGSIGPNEVARTLPPGALLSAVLFSAGATVELSRLRDFFGFSDAQLSAALDESKECLKSSGLTIIEVAGGVKMVTVPEAYETIEAFFQRTKQTGLSKAALETVSVIAYKQPCTRTDVEEIRGVNCEGVIKGLLEKRLIKVKERTEGPGRPFSYVTTDRFLEIFGLKSLKDLPKVELQGEGSSKEA